MAGCGIDIVDENNKVVYADASLERRYGDWHGRSCHDYFCDSDCRATSARRPEAFDEAGHHVVDLHETEWNATDDPHARVHHIEGKSIRMIGIPFRDAGGRWLYARVHLPLAVPAEETPSDAERGGSTARQSGFLRRVQEITTQSNPA